MALTKVKDWNPTDPGRLAQVVVWGVRGTDGEAYVMEVNPATGAFPLSTGSTIAAAFAPVSGLGLALVANTWLQFIASTAADLKIVQYINESGYAVEVGVGAAGAEVSKFVMAEAGEVTIAIAAGSRIALRCATSNTLPVFWLSAFA